MRKWCIWFYMLTKRLVFRRSFLVILLLIPLLLPLVEGAMRDDSGVLRIALCGEGTDNPGAEEIIGKLMAEDSILRYAVYPTAAEAREAVRNNRADAAWIFAADFREAASKFAARKTVEPPVTVVERETGVTLRLSHEKLYGALYPYIVRSAYLSFVEKSFSPEKGAMAETVFDESDGGGNIIRLEKLHPAGTVAENYLTAPLRGLLSLVVMLSGLVAAMYALEDRQAGRYDWLSPRKQILPIPATCAGALTLTATAMIAAMYAAGKAGTPGMEIAAGGLFVVSATVFCTALALVFRKPGRLGMALPGILLFLLAFSPIFFHTRLLYPIQLLLPTYYYLQALYNPAYLLYMVFYTVGAGMCIFLLQNLKTQNKKSRKNGVF